MTTPGPIRRFVEAASSMTRKRADCRAMSKEMSTFRVAAAMMAPLSTPRI